MISALMASSLAMAQTTIIQSNTGIGCSTVCINGNCTSNCGEENSDVMKGNGEVKDKTFALTDFSEVVSTDIDTSVSQGEAFAIKVIADSNLLDRITVRKEGNVLHIGLKSGQYENATLSVEVTMPDLRKLTQRGAADLNFSGFDQANLILLAQGAGQIRGNDNIVTDLSLHADGAMSLDMTASELTNADINILGSGSVRLNLPGDKGRITGQIQGVSELSYCGDPSNEVEIFGVADIQRINCS